MTTLWRAIVEGSWARSIVSAVAVPKARKVQEGEDLQQLYRCIRTMQMQKDGRSSSMHFQRLLLQVRSDLLVSKGLIGAYANADLLYNSPDSPQILYHCITHIMIARTQWAFLPNMKVSGCFQCCKKLSPVLLARLIDTPTNTLIALHAAQVELSRAFSISGLVLLNTQTFISFGADADMLSALITTNDICCQQIVTLKPVTGSVR